MAWLKWLAAGLIGAGITLAIIYGIIKVIVIAILVGLIW